MNSIGETGPSCLEGWQIAPVHVAQQLHDAPLVRQAEKAQSIRDHNGRMCLATLLLPSVVCGTVLWQVTRKLLGNWEVTWVAAVSCNLCAARRLRLLQQASPTHAAPLLIPLGYRLQALHVAGPGSLAGGRGGSRGQK
eukprot:gnl/TRDRNA2_/TRDRNA2_159727_c0_seq5.p1 gnl/TRDRNA2_/TRDRNA2_159727_c0~~gnl/TRDRNA2_/TRDRNA2_159727_c0_seq5.p1  ORF type:complete len:138 (-),score=11.50 gnl/TRDRNA2_/TRDRNA2_159727_c0_seq5:24-437(-)